VIKTEKKYEDLPILFFNDGEEHKKAYLKVLASGIKCEFMAPSLEEEPILLVGYTRYRGLKEIEEFLKEETEKRGKNF